MCGRFAFFSPSEATAALFGVDMSIELKPRYNIAPTQDIAAIRMDTEDTVELVMLRWGLVPFWLHLGPYLFQCIQPDGILR